MTVLDQGRGSQSGEPRGLRWGSEGRGELDREDWERPWRQRGWRGDGAVSLQSEGMKYWHLLHTGKPCKHHAE